jgi:hypothetical protein
MGQTKPEATQKTLNPNTPHISKIQFSMKKIFFSFLLLLALASVFAQGKFVMAYSPGIYGGPNFIPDTATVLRPDTIKINFMTSNTYRVLDSANLRWNNALLTVAPVTFTAKNDTFHKLRWADPYSISGISVILWHSNGWLSYRYASCSNPVVPSIVWQIASQSDGSTSIGDPVLGGRNIIIDSLNPLQVYDIVVLSTKDSGVAVNQTITSLGKSSSMNIANNCSGYMKLASLSPDGNGKLVVNIHGTTPTAKTWINALYIIAQRVTSRIITTAAPPPQTGPINLSPFPLPKGFVAPPEDLATADTYMPPWNHGANKLDIGFNVGYYGTLTHWDDSDLVRLGAKLGATGMRNSLDHGLLYRFGWANKQTRFNAYVNQMGQRGMMTTTGKPATPGDAFGNNVEFMDTAHYAGIGRPHSQLFKEMYKPIFLIDANGDTTLNDDNPAVFYYHNLATLYPGVKLWEVQNEPDFTGLGNKDLWLQREPYPLEVAPNQYDSMWHYVRLMRIAYSVLNFVHPGTLVAPGGLGYYQYLDAMLRYSDNPGENGTQPGSLTPNYPHTGGAYFNVVSYHKYPHYYMKRAYSGLCSCRAPNINSDTAAALYNVEHIPNWIGTLKKYGYDGSKYPMKYFSMSETNIPRKTTWAVNRNDSTQFVMLQYGDSIVQRNFTVKSFVAMEKLHFDVITFFTLGEHNYWPGDSTWWEYSDSIHLANPFKKYPYIYHYIRDGDEYAFTAAYNNLNAQDKGKDSLTWQGIAAKTYLLRIHQAGYYYDSLRTRQLGITYGQPTDPNKSGSPQIAGALPWAVGAFDGAAFTDGQGNYKYVLWARTSGDMRGSGEEALQVNYSFPAGLNIHNVKRYDWNWSVTATLPQIPATNITLTATPSIFEVLN